METPGALPGYLFLQRESILLLASVLSLISMFPRCVDIWVQLCLLQDYAHLCLFLWCYCPLYSFFWSYWLAPFRLYGVPQYPSVCPYLMLVSRAMFVWGKNKVRISLHLLGIYYVYTLCLQSSVFLHRVSYHEFYSVFVYCI